MTGCGEDVVELVVETQRPRRLTQRVPCLGFHAAGSEARCDLAEVLVQSPDQLGCASRAPAKGARNRDGMSHPEPEQVVEIDVAQGSQGKVMVENGHRSRAPGAEGQGRGCGDVGRR